jgi:hypothetical protein
VLAQVLSGKFLVDTRGPQPTASGVTLCGHDVETREEPSISERICFISCFVHDSFSARIWVNLADECQHSDAKGCGEMAVTVRHSQPNSITKFGFGELRVRAVSTEFCA